MERGAAQLENQRAEMKKLAQAREDLKDRERRHEAALAESEARMKAAEQQEKQLKEKSEALARERAEAKAMWKNLETERARVAHKEKAIDSLVTAKLVKERASVTEEAQAVRAMAESVKGKDKSAEQERVRLKARERELQALRSASRLARPRSGGRKTNSVVAAKRSDGCKPRSRNSSDHGRSIGREGAIPRNLAGQPYACRNKNAVPNRGTKINELNK